MCFSRPLLAALIVLASPLLVRAQDWTAMGGFTRSINCIYFLPAAGEPVSGFVGTGDFDLGQGEIYRTSDSGHTWTKTDFHPLGDESVTDILFRDKNVGWATTLTSRDDRGRVYRTTDGGHSWEPTSAMPGVYLGIGYSSSSHLLFVARGGAAAMLSSDDGQTWRPTLESTVTSFGFVDDSIGFAAGSHRFSAKGSTFATTRDGGRTWRYSSLNKECYQPLLLPGSHELYAIEEGSGALYVSRDLGETWDTIYRFSTPSQWMSGCIRGNKCGRLYAQSGYSKELGLVVSEDRGRSWRDLHPPTQNSPLANTIDTRFFAQGDVVYAARRTELTGGVHTLYRYRRGGTTQSGSGAPFAMERSVVMRSPGCEYSDTTLTIAYPNDCAAATLIEASCPDSIHFELLGESLPKRLSNVTPLRLAFIPTADDTVRSFLALTYEIGDAVIHDTVSLTGYLAEGVSLTRLQLSGTRQADALHAGDTATLNIELRDALPARLALDSLECTIRSEGDMLSALRPTAAGNWTITSSLVTPSAITIRLRAPRIDENAGAVIARVPLRLMLSLDTFATVRLEQVRWYGASWTGCEQLATSLLSVAMSRATNCGDPTVTQYMRDASLPVLRIDVRSTAVEATVALDAETPCEVSIVNTLGEQLATHGVVLAQGTHSLQFTKPMAPGVYYFVFQAGRTRLTRSFIVN